VSSRDFEKDYYAVLGVSKTASAAEIKKAYRSLARKHHPDANKGDAASEAKFKDISEAYDVLSDATRRKEYDDARALFAGGGFRAGMPGAGGAPFDVSDLFGQAGGAGGLGDVLGGLFGRGRAGAGPTASTRGPRRGADVESEVTLSFRESVDGVTVPLRLTSDAPCPVCQGTGAKAGTAPRVCPTCGGSGTTSRDVGGFGFAEPCRECRGRGLVVDDPCPTCHGSGRGQSTRTVNARIPAGVGDGQRIRLKGRGAPGERGGPGGDLYITVHVRADAVFGRSGDNLTLTVPVTFPEAALGAAVTVPTLHGPPVTVKVPAGTPNGRTFRVKGKGVSRKDGGHGDLLVTVEVAVPARLSEDARSALAAFAEATAGEDPRAGLGGAS